MFDKSLKTNKTVNNTSSIKEKGSAILSLISIIFIIVIMVGFIYMAAYSMLATANPKQARSHQPSLVAFCQTNQCVANITSQGY